MVKMIRDTKEPGYNFTELEVFEHEVKSFEARGYKVAGRTETKKEEPKVVEEKVEEPKEEPKVTSKKINKKLED